MPRRRVSGVASPARLTHTHYRTHTQRAAPDRMEAAQDPGEDDARDPAAVKEGVADTWDRVVSRSRKRRKRKGGGEENGPSSAQTAQEEEKPMKTFGPTTRIFLFLLHGTDTRVPPIGETRRLTSEPLRPMTVDC